MIDLASIPDAIWVKSKHIVGVKLLESQERWSWLISDVENVYDKLVVILVVNGCWKIVVEGLVDFEEPLSCEFGLEGWYCVILYVDMQI